MKKFLTILAIAAMLFLASACNGKRVPAEPVEEAPVEVVDSLEVAVDSTAVVLEAE